jgi:hypothetical protein
MLEHYLDSSPEVFERLSVELPPSTTKSKKAAKEKTKKYLDDWDKTWVNAGKSDSKYGEVVMWMHLHAYSMESGRYWHFEWDG